MNKDGFPFFSVIIPLYNKEQFVERCIRSVLAQRCGDYELIVVDDGSSDASAAVVRSISDPRIKILTQSNQGVSAARNKGAKSAAGQWLAFLDADDQWGHDHLAELKLIIDTFSEVGAVATSSREVLEGGDSKFLEMTQPGRLRVINYFKEAQKEIGVLNASSIAIRRNVFSALGGFGTYRYGEDLEYWARLALRYSVAKSDRETVVYYRENGGAMDNMAKTALSGAPLPRTLSDLSPSVAMLYAHLSDLSRHAEMYQSVLGYINARLLQALRGSFIRGDINRLKALRALWIFPPVGVRQRRWWLFAALPSPMLVFLSRLRAFVKRFYLWFR